MIKLSDGTSIRNVASGSYEPPKEMFKYVVGRAWDCISHNLSATSLDRLEISVAI